MRPSHLQASLHEVIMDSPKAKNRKGPIVRTPTRGIALLAMGLLIGPMSTQAAVVTYEVKGVVDSFDAGNVLLPWTSSDIAVGSQFSVLYEYDDAFPDSNANTNIGTYQESIISMVVTIGPQSFALPLGTGGGAGDQAHTVANDVLQGSNYVDQLAYTRVGCVNFAPDGLSNSCYRGVVLLREASILPSSILSSDARVDFPSMFSSFSTREFRFSAADIYTTLDGSASVRDGFVGTITSVSPVPLPATVWLLLSGLGGLSLLGRRRGSA